MGTFLQSAMLAISVAVVGGYVCRLNSLQFSQHCPIVIVMHMALCLSAVWSGYHAYTGLAGGWIAVDIGDGAAVFGAAAWLVISYPSWRHGVPAHFMANPLPLKWPRISGAGKRTHQ